MRRLILSLISCVYISFSACASGTASSARPNMGERAWRPTDLLTGPAGVAKGVVSVPLCPLRLSSKTIAALGDPAMSAGETTFEVVALPLKAAIDGVSTGVAYVIGGILDTVTGGALGVIERAEGEAQPGTNVTCLIAGRSEY